MYATVRKLQYIYLEIFVCKSSGIKVCLNQIRAPNVKQRYLFLQSTPNYFSDHFCKNARHVCPLLST